MKFLIYGTGGRAKRYIEFRYMLFFEEHETIAFVDSDPKKKGGLFAGKPIILPDDIESYEYDYILIASSYEQEIESILVDKYNVKKEKIKKAKDITRFEMEMVTKYRGIFRNQKVIGLYYDKFDNLENYQIKCKSDVDVSNFFYYKDIAQIMESKFDYIVLLDPKRSQTFDWKTDKYVLENELIAELEKAGIDKEKVYRSSLVYSFGYTPKCVTYGSDNEDVTFLVIQFMANAGLATIVFTAVKGIKYAYEQGYIPVVDCQTYKSQYHEADEAGKVNAWEKFFEQPTSYTMEDVLRSKNVILFADVEGSSALVAEDFHHYIVTKPIIKEKIDKYCEMQGIGISEDKVLGVLYRGSDYNNVKPYDHHVQPTLNQLIAKVKEMCNNGGYKKIYICTEVQDAILRFEEEFPGQVISYNQRRCEEGFAKYLSEFAKGFEYSWGEDYWVAINVLARCDALVGGICGGTLYAKTLSEHKYDEVYLFDLGKYRC